MAFGFKTKQKATETCLHSNEVTIEVAGMSRSVCESCGRVSVGYVGNAYPPELVDVEGTVTPAVESSDG